MNFFGFAAQIGAGEGALNSWLTSKAKPTFNRPAPDHPVSLGTRHCPWWCERLRMFGWLVFQTPGAPVLFVL
jgi:hypothetical protein